LALLRVLLCPRPKARTMRRLLSPPVIDPLLRTVLLLDATRMPASPAPKLFPTWIAPALVIVLWSPSTKMPPVGVTASPTVIVPPAALVMVLLAPAVIPALSAPKEMVPRLMTALLSATEMPTPRSPPLIEPALVMRLKLFAMMPGPLQPQPGTRIEPRLVTVLLSKTKMPGPSLTVMVPVTALVMVL